MGFESGRLHAPPPPMTRVGGPRAFAERPGPAWCRAGCPFATDFGLEEGAGLCEGFLWRGQSASSAGRLRWRSGGRVADAVEGGEVLGVGVGEGVEVLLGGGDLGMTHAVHHRLEVGAAGEQPGGVGVAQVVDADVEVDARGGDGGSPDPGAEGVPGDGGAVAGGEQQVTGPEPPVGDRSRRAGSTSSGGRPMVRGSLSLG